MLTRYILSSCVCLSVCPSVRHKPVLYRNHHTNRAGFWHDGFHPHVPDCVIRNFGYLQNSGTYKVPSKTLSETLDLEDFVTVSRPHCQQNSSTVELVDDTQTTVDESWLFTARRSAVTLELHYFCCGFAIQLVSTVMHQFTRF